MVKIMKRLNKWLEAISLVIMGLLMCYGSRGKEGVLPIESLPRSAWFSVLAPVSSGIGRARKSGCARM